MEISTGKIQVEICFYFLSEKKTKRGPTTATTMRMREPNQNTQSTKKKPNRPDQCDTQR